MDKRTFWRKLTRVHKWVGLILGLQILIWTASGFFMSFFDIENVRGEHVAHKTTDPLPIIAVIGPDKVIEAYRSDTGKAPKTILLKTVKSLPIYVADDGDNTRYYNALTGMLWPGINEKTARSLADSYYAGKGHIQSLRKLDKAPIEYRGILPVWQIKFDDSSKTRLYLSDKTGELKAVRTRLWRVYDFMWMLHIMDYKTRDNFNRWWLKLLAFSAALFALSGLALVAHRIFLRPRPKRPKRS